MTVLLSIILSQTNSSPSKNGSRDMTFVWGLGLFSGGRGLFLREGKSSKGHWWFMLLVYSQFKNILRDFCLEIPSVKLT